MALLTNYYKNLPIVTDKFMITIMAGDVYLIQKKFGKIVMVDTKDIRNSYSKYRSKMNGDVLVLGLGLGRVIVDNCGKPELHSMDVVEIDHGIIRIVGKTLKSAYGDKLSLYDGDAYTWEPDGDKLYDFILIDVQSNLDNASKIDYKALLSRYKKYLKPRGSVEVFKF